MCYTNLYLQCVILGQSSLTTYKTAQLHNPEDHNRHLPPWEQKISVFLCSDFLIIFTQLRLHLRSDLSSLCFAFLVSPYPSYMPNASHSWFESHYNSNTTWMVRIVKLLVLWSCPFPVKPKYSQHFLSNSFSVFRVDKASLNKLSALSVGLVLAVLNQ
jgi:hypothetical protein